MGILIFGQLLSVRIGFTHFIHIQRLKLIRKALLTY